MADDRPRGSADHRAIACNYAEGTGVAAVGALAYVVPSHLGGNLPERVRVLVRSRGGRWVDKWESMRRLDSFRVKTIPPDHPRYVDERITLTGDADEALRRCQQAREEVRRGR